MYFVLVAYVKSELDKIDGFRKKYDTQFNLIRPHVTIVFPISAKSISEDLLLEHV